MSVLARQTADVQDANPYAIQGTACIREIPVPLTIALLPGAAPSRAQATRCQLQQQHRRRRRRATREGPVSSLSGTDTTHPSPPSKCHPTQHYSLSPLPRPLFIYPLKSNTSAVPARIALEGCCAPDLAACWVPSFYPAWPEQPHTPDRPPVLPITPVRTRDELSFLAPGSPCSLPWRHPGLEVACPG